MFLWLLGYLETKEVHALLNGTLHEVSDDPDSRFCALKKRLLEHLELLQKETGFGGEMVQRMIDILGTDGNYEEILASVVAGNTEGPPSLESIIKSIIKSTIKSTIKFTVKSTIELTKKITPDSIQSMFDNPSKTTLNGYKLDQMDDTNFLTKICTIITEKPAYRQIVEEILQEATKSLGIKLNKLKKELISLVRVQVAHIVKQETNKRVDSEKRIADQAGKVRLRSLIREALDAEADHPTSR